MGPDKIATVHLKHIGPAGIEYLTHIFNLSLKFSQIPDIWKTSKIIPLLKPGKDPTESKSYRPVSLLCPAIKIMERLILPTLTQHLPVPDIQHGFRKDHSTVTALHEFNQQIAQGFNQRKPAHRTVLLQLDLSKAFDMVSHNKLLKDGLVVIFTADNLASFSETRRRQPEMSEQVSCKARSPRRSSSIFTWQTSPLLQQA